MEKPDADEAVFNRLIDELSLGELIIDRFWGSVEIQFQNGYPVTIKKTETKRLKGNNPNAKDTR